jgi:Ni/Co efflux regulator RcnB
MRRFLISAAALALLAATACLSPVSAQPDSHRVGKASVAPQVQDRAQAELRHQAQPQQQDGGGRGGDRGRGDRSGAPAPQATIQSAAPMDRGGRDRNDRGNWQGRGDRGGVPATQATVQPVAPMDRGGRDRNDRGNWQGRGDRNSLGYWQGPNDRGNGRGADRRDWDTRRDFNRGDFNRDGRTDYRRGASYGGPRHDFSGFRDYHRTFNASRRFRAPYYRRPAGWYDHRWSFGEFLPAAFWARDYWLVDFEVYDLPPPPFGAVWVRVGSDVLLVDEESGEIITVAYGIFY